MTNIALVADVSDQKIVEIIDETVFYPDVFQLIVSGKTICFIWYSGSEQAGYVVGQRENAREDNDPNLLDLITRYIRPRIG